MKYVKMIIHADGSCSVDAMGFLDVTCTHATQQILAALGGPITEDHLKPEAQRLPPRANRRREEAR